MRFKRLRFAVGISLATFIFIIGIILAFGLLGHSSNTNQQDLVLLPPTYYDSKPSVSSSNSGVVQQANTNTVPQTVTHRIVRSRAS